MCVFVFMSGICIVNVGALYTSHQNSCTLELSSSHHIQQHNNIAENAFNWTASRDSSLKYLLMNENDSGDDINQADIGRMMSSSGLSFHVIRK